MAYNSYRNIPVGYAAVIVAVPRYGIAQYLACGDQNTAVDFLGIYNRKWCKHDTYDTSCYRAMISAHSRYPVPNFLAEYGCLSFESENLSEVACIYGSNLTMVMSGGFVLRVLLKQ